MISEERLTKALQYLAKTDEHCARQLGLYRGLEDQSKSVYAQCFIESNGSTVKEREMSAYRDPRYVSHVAKIDDARVEYETMRLRRSTEERVIEVWRSLNANQRRGNI